MAALGRINSLGATSPQSTYYAGTSPQDPRAPIEKRETRLASNCEARMDQLASRQMGARRIRVVARLTVKPPPNWPAWCSRARARARRCGGDGEGDRPYQPRRGARADAADRTQGFAPAPARGSALALPLSRSRRTGTKIQEAAMAGFCLAALGGFDTVTTGSRTPTADRARSRSRTRPASQPERARTSENRAAIARR